MTSDQAIEFIECLTVPKGKLAGTAIRLLDWQKDYLIKLLDTQDAEGFRQYTESLLLLPKKNGKTTFAACISLAFLFLEKELGGEIYTAANTRDQASICFDAAVSMIRNDPYLKSLVRIVDSQKKIYHKESGTVYQALSADGTIQNGKNPSLIIYDEICEAKSPRLYEALTTGTAARQQPLTLSISTSGDKGTIGHQLYEHAVKIRDGVITDNSFLGVLYEVPPDADWTDIKVWEKANPSWGITVEPKYAAKKIESAKNTPTRLNELLRYHLNVWVDRSVAWIPSATWNANDRKYNLADLKGKRCYIGLDLATTTDTTALNLIFPLDDGYFATVPRFYLPRNKARQRYTLDRVPYPTWIKEGFIVETDTDIADYDRIRRDIGELSKEYDIQAIAIDRWNAAQLSQQLKDDGFVVEGFGQGWKSMTPPSRLMEEILTAKKLMHNDNPVMKWMASNVVAETDAAGNVKPNKKRSIEKIDGIVAMIMGLGMSIIKGNENTKSVYEDRGIRRI